MASNSLQSVIVFKINSIDVGVFDDLESAKDFALRISENTGDGYLIFCDCKEVGRVDRKAVFTKREYF
jgi:hypothetical protein